MAPSVVEVIGSTPAVELGRVSRGLRGRIVAKLEGEHAGGTVAVVLADSGLKYLSTDLWPDVEATMGL